jgi:MurNAc alpha-1-phosphate uridylyltransferase
MMAHKPTTAMVMAAGLGKRMRPLTASRPKPLVKVAGKALIDHALDRLAASGVTRAVVNVHYLAGSLEAHLQRNAHGLDIAISDERDKLLETGGGLIKALPLLGEDPVLAVNSDNLWVDGPMDTVKGDFYMEAGGRIARRKPGRIAPFVFTGVQLISKRLLVDPPADAFSTNVFWDRGIASGRAFGVVHQGLWFDVGTPGAIPKTEAALLSG